VILDGPISKKDSHGNGGCSPTGFETSTLRITDKVVTGAPELGLRPPYLDQEGGSEAKASS